MKKKILKYFETGKLEILDEDIRIFKLDHYTGVTAGYILEYVLKNKFTKKRVINLLIKLHSEKQIKALYCGNVKEVVFENIDSAHWNYGEQEHGYDKQRYTYFLDEMKKLKEDNE